MATQTTGGGSTTSFTNTPQANEDTFNYIEDELRANATLYDISSHTVFLDVMSNDLGGKAKTLFSIDDGEGALTELLTSNVTTGWEQTSDGNWIRINAGKIEFRIGNGTPDSSDVRDVNTLGEGETIDDTFLYAIRMANGTLAYATVHITITGTNDVATISGDNDGDVVEDTTLTASGTLVVSDVDTGENELVPVAAGTAGDNGYGTFEVNANGQWTYTLNNAHAAVQALPDGETLTDTITVWSEDGTDSETITVTITGTNDVATISGDNDGDVVEDTTLTASGTLVVSDVDTGENELVPVAAGTAGDNGYGTFEVNANGQWTYTLNNAHAAVQALPDGETLTDTITVWSEDGTDSETITVTITGTNDNPELTGAQAVLPDGTEDQAYIVSAASLLAGFTDVDSGTVLAVFGLTADHGSVIYNGDGTYTVTPDADYFGTVTLSYSVIDGDGGSVPATLAFTLAPVNDPAVISGTTTGSVVEATSSDPGTPTATGTLLAADVDNPPNTFIAVASTPTASGYGSFSMTAAGVWTYTLNNANAAVNALATGMFLIDTFTVQSADGTMQTITVTINGATDMIVVTPPPTYNGTGDPNDFDNAGPAAGATVTNSTSMGVETWNGTNGNDAIAAGNGTDNVYGHDGDDSLNGENGSDISLYGQAGNDTITGGSGSDQIYGGSGNDTIYGNEPPPTNESGDAGDTIYGGSGNDIIYGQGGNDIIIGGYGADTLTGGGGVDTFVYLSVLDTNDTILDFMSGEEIDLSALGLAGWSGDAPTANSLWMVEAGGNTTLFADTDGNPATAEFMLTLQGFTGFDPLTPPPEITF